MAYLGNAPARSFISFERQVFTIVNSQTAYTLDHSVNNENDIRLVVNNIVQEPGSGKAYTASGTTLTLSAALTNGTDEMYCVFLGRAVATNAPGAGSVNTAAIAADAVTTAKITDLNVTTAKIAADAITEAKIADDAVESEHLNNNIISGQTELASEPADTDEFLVSDAGTIKRIDYSLIKATSGLSVADQWRVSSDATMAGGSTDITSNIEQIDSSGQNTVGSDMSVSSGVFTFPETGIYLVRGVANFRDNGSSRYTGLKLRATFDGGSSFSTLGESYDSITQAEGHTTYANVVVDSLVNVGNTSNDKVKFTVDTSLEVTLTGNSGLNATYFTFLKMN